MMPSKEHNLSELLSKSDAILLLELLSSCVSCSDEESYKSLFGKLRELTQHDHCTTGIATVDDKGITGRFDVINIDYPTDWMMLYLEKGFNEVDPVVKSNFCRYEPQFWKELYKKEPPPKDFVMLAEDFGISFGITHGVKNMRGNKGSLFSFAGDHIEQSERTEAVVSLAIPHLTLALDRVLGLRRLPDVKKLTKREVEILKWIANGKSNWDISVILNIHRRTVETHIKNIMFKLDVVNRAQAVAVALESGIVELG